MSSDEEPRPWADDPAAPREMRDLFAEARADVLPAARAERVIARLGAVAGAGAAGGAIGKSAWPRWGAPLALGVVGAIAVIVAVVARTSSGEEAAPMVPAAPGGAAPESAGEGVAGEERRAVVPGAREAAPRQVGDSVPEMAERVVRRSERGAVGRQTETEAESRIELAAETEIETEAEGEAAAGTDLAEGTLLLRARRALDRSPAEALALADEHAARFGDGRMAPEREVIAIDALRALDRRAEARARASRFLARHPSSPYRERVEAAAAAVRD
jgi:hypothetical protein